MLDLPTLTEVILLVLAVNQVVETFRHSDLSFVAGIRARMELSDGLTGQLASCMFCLSHWVGLGIMVWYAMAFWYFGATIERILAMVPVYALSLARGAQILNDVLYPYCRTPSNRKPTLEPGE